MVTVQGDITILARYGHRISIGGDRSVMAAPGDIMGRQTRPRRWT